MRHLWRFSGWQRILTAAVTITFCAAAQSLTWQDSRLPGNGDISVLENAGAQFLAGSASGRIFRSGDDGAHWSQVSGPGDDGITDFLDLDTVLLAASGTKANFKGIGNCAELPCRHPENLGRILRSSDRGLTWKPIALKAVTALATLDKDVYAATLNGFFRSDNGGATWAPLPLRGTTGQTRPDWTDPQKYFSGVAGVFTMGTFAGKLFLGAAGSLFEIIPGRDTATVRLLRPDGAGVVKHGNVLLIHLAEGILQSANGADWERVSTTWFYSLIPWDGALLGITPDYRIHRSTDGGRTWAAFQARPRGASLVYCGRGETLFAATGSSGLLKSIGGPASAWTPTSEGMYEYPARSLAFSEGSLLAAAIPGGSFRRGPAAGDAWQALGTDRFWPQHFASGRGAVYAAGSTLAVSTRGGAPGTWDSLALCEQGCAALVAGDGWTAAYQEDNTFILCEGASCTHLPRTRLPASRRPPAPGPMEGTIRAAAARGDTMVVAIDSLYRSEDRGRTWKVMGSGAGFHGTLLALNADGIYSDGSPGTSPGGPVTSLFLSRDGGSYWIKQTIEAAGPGTLIRALAFRGREIYVGTTDGLFRRKEAGAAWEDLGVGLPSRNVRSLAVEGDQLAVGTEDGRVFMADLEGVSVRHVAAPRGPAAGEAYRPGYGWLDIGGAGWRRADGRAR